MTLLHIIPLHTIRVNHGVDKDTTLENTYTQNTQIDIWLTWQRGKAERLVTSVPCGRGNVFGMLLAFIAPLKV